MKKHIIIIAVSILVGMETFAQDTEIRSFIFGHSLIDHRPPLIATPGDETTVPHWLFLLAETAGHTYAAGGQYGFLLQHANLQPISQWGYDIVPGVWESDTESFAGANINNVMLTAANFAQYQSPDQPIEVPDNTDMLSPISATEIIVDWVSENTDGAGIYIYENWPDMAGFLQSGFPPSNNEFDDYNTYTTGDFHTWWLQYQDALLDSRPELKVRMIPVGPILAGLTSDLLSDVNIDELYEDDAPHGRPNIYFLASLCTYMSIYAEKAPLDFEVPELIDEKIKARFEQIVDFIWDYLVGFTDEEGESRVFYENVSAVSSTPDKPLKIAPNPVRDVLSLDIDSQVNDRLLIMDITGVSRGAYEGGTSEIILEGLESGVYFLQIQFEDGSQSEAIKFIKL